MTTCQRTNVGVAREVARWLQAHGAALLVDDRLDDVPVRYRLVEVGAPIDTARARFRTPREFARAIETPGAIAWT